jgi:exopolysaccharide biosynthesis polyprenyl glycosylphosphotransferase
MEAHTQVQSQALPVPAGLSALRSDRPLLGSASSAQLERETLRRDRIFRRALAVADLAAGFLAATFAITQLGPDGLHPGAVLVGPLVLVAAKAIGLYDRDELLIRKTTVEELPKLFQLSVLYMLIFWLGDQLLIHGPLGKDQAAGLGGLFLVSSFLLRREARKLAGRLTVPERVLFIGDERSYRRLNATFQRHRMPAQLSGRMSIEETMPVHLDATGTDIGLDGLIADAGAHRVVIGPHQLSPQMTFELVQAIRRAGAKVSLLPDMLEVAGSNVEFDDLFGTTVLGVRDVRLSRSSHFLKRALDLVGAGLLTLAVAPVMVLIALWIKLDTPGPVFFRQTRVGRDGKAFRIFKFRTMCEDAEAKKDELRILNEAGDLFKLAADPRVTPVGRILRKTSLDELPQLINVLLGQMSLVGPRPLVVDEDTKITGSHRGRLRLTPGMTGAWQILGSSRVPMEEMVKLDHLYVSSWTLWSDVQILLRTIPYVVSRRGQ